MNLSKKDVIENGKGKRERNLQQGEDMEVING